MRFLSNFGLVIHRLGNQYDCRDDDGRKECVETDQAQMFQQFNLQADVDRHDLIFDVVEDIAKILIRAGTQYLKTDYDNLRDSLDSIVTLAKKFGFVHLSRGAQDVKFCVDGNDLVAVSSTFQRLLRVGEQSLFAIWDMLIYS